VGDVSGKGAPAALYGAFAAELVRSRTMRRRYTPDRFSVSGVLQAMNNILHERQLEEYYCTLCYAFFDLAGKVMTISNSGLPYPFRCSGSDCAEIELAGVPLGSFPGSTYDELRIPLQKDDLFVFYSDGISDALGEAGAEFGTRRLREVIGAHAHETPRAIVDAIFNAVTTFRGARAQGDDMTVVAVRITA
jgi:sigma-B regulation protein RsbU (phosphoserine phosphatase)